VLQLSNANAEKWHFRAKNRIWLGLCFTGAPNETIVLKAEHTKLQHILAGYIHQSLAPKVLLQQQNII